MATMIEQPKPRGGLADSWMHTSKTRTAGLFPQPAFLVLGRITFYPLFYQVWMYNTDNTAKKQGIK